MSLKKAIGQAVRLYKSFRERDPKSIGKVRLTIPRAVATIGYVEGIDYRTTHGKKVTLYHHDFAPGSRPLLAVSADGLQLLLLGGRYQFTEQGIVDKDAQGALITNPGHGKTINPRTHGLEVSRVPLTDGGELNAWWDSGARTYIVQQKDAEGNQVGEAEYVYNRAGVPKLQEYMIASRKLTVAGKTRKGNPGKQALRQNPTRQKKYTYGDPPGWRIMLRFGGKDVRFFPNDKTVFADRGLAEDYAYDHVRTAVGDDYTYRLVPRLKPGPEPML